jgi:putative nucleotidyltransferase with HDIG domain
MTAPDRARTVSPQGAPRARLVIVDDEDTFLEMLRELLLVLEYEVASFNDPFEAVAFGDRNPGWADVLISDKRMPGLDGTDVINRLRKTDPDLVCILATGFSNVDNAVEAIRAGAFDFITKPFAEDLLKMVLNRALEHRRVLLENRHYHQSMEQLLAERGQALKETTRHLELSYQFMLESLVSLLEAREPLTGEHTKRVTGMSVALARRMGIEGDELETIRRGASLHDVGKIAIPDAILLKPGPLDDEEWAVMKTHVSIGYNLMKSNPYMSDVAELIHSHHENFDGSGYPRGLREKEICRGARIFSVVDAYDAIRSTRTYSRSTSAADTLREIQRCSGSQFDPEVVACLQENHAEIEQVWWEGATQSDRQATPLTLSHK